MAKVDRPLIFTDDGWIMTHEPPLTPEIILEKMIKPLADTPAALWWSVGDHEVYHYETQVGEIMGEGRDLAEFPDDLGKMAANVRHLSETSGGPLSVLVDLCRQAGVEFLPLDFPGAAPDRCRSSGRGGGHHHLPEGDVTR